MTKIILIILGILLVAGGVYYFLSKPIQIQLQLLPAPTLQAPSESVAPTESSAPVLPVSGAKITIKDCKGDPQILQISNGAEVMFLNADDTAHTIFIAGANMELKLAPRGSTKFVARRPQNVPANLDFTDNYICDSQTFSGGAIYIPAR